MHASPFSRGTIGDGIITDRTRLSRRCPTMTDSIACFSENIPLNGKPETALMTCDISCQIGPIMPCRRASFPDHAIIATHPH
ncbi:hypothetical protein [Burkholderia plantarii]|uniref:hypothetical protein n=1 Tax=Burkholderia plantarii TaxID=41899 RepID=UPI000F4D3733|nr:hypothetical protein [Burkholderia plantarii]